MLMQRRKRWVESIGPVFEKDPMTLPKESIFSDIDELVSREKAGAILEDET